jgi:pimeloyl-ACP methyl ester carboxylesterase
MVLTKQICVCDAHWPRENSASVVSPDDRLKIVYAVYQDDRFDTSTADPDSLLNLVFAHGTQMCKETWEYMISLAFDRFGAKLGRVISVDAANHGDSHQLNKGKLSWTVTWSDGGKDLVCVLRDVALRGTTILVGHSMGGAQCLYASFYEPALIDSVVVLDPVAYMDPELYGNREITKFFGTRLQKLTKFVRAEFKDKNDYLNYMNKVGISRGFHPNVRQDYIDNSAIYNPDGSVSFKTSFEQQMVSYASSGNTLRDLMKIMSCLDLEVLHVCGDIHDWNPAESQQKILEALQHGTGAIVEGGKHLVPFEMPVETFEAMSAFLEKRRDRGTHLAKEMAERRMFTQTQRDKYVVQGLKQVLDSLSLGDRYSFAKL